MSVLDDIRHAALELRHTDPQEAVRILRRAAAEGGEAEVLARGALGEIYLEDFGDWWLNRRVLAYLQREDLYHVLKHKRRLRKDEMTKAELEQAGRKSALLRLHRFLRQPQQPRPARRALRWVRSGARAPARPSC